MRYTVIMNDYNGADEMELPRVRIAGVFELKSYAELFVRAVRESLGSRSENTAFTIIDCLQAMDEEVSI